MNDFQMYEQGRKEAKQCNIAIVSGSYYWVKCFTDDKYEPTVAVDHYNNGTMYFKFLNGAVRECRLVADYKELTVSINGVADLMN